MNYVVPIALKNYSDTFMVRVPPQVHKKVAVEAAESGVSRETRPIGRERVSGCRAHCFPEASDSGLL
jgi:hypothetical protein